MAKPSYCKVCGVELTSENRYSNGNNKRRYCKKHWSEHVTKRKQIFTLKVRRGRISFATYLDKHSFVTGRRLQARFGRGHISPSSNYGKAVYVKIQEEKQDGDKTIIIKRYVPLKCDTQKCSGTVRSKDNGFQICDKCGLVANDRFAVFHIDDYPSYRKQNWKKRVEYIPVPETESRGDSDSTIKCFDRYYAQAYSKRLR